MVAKRSQAATKKNTSRKKNRVRKNNAGWSKAMHKIAELKRIKRIMDTWDTRVMSCFIDVDMSCVPFSAHLWE